MGSDSVRIYSKAILLVVDSVEMGVGLEAEKMGTDQIPFYADGKLSRDE